MKINPAFRIRPMSLLIILGLLLTHSFAGPVSHFGALIRCKDNKHICGEKTGDEMPIFVKGPSLGWSSGMGEAFYNAETVDWLVENFQIGVIRAAMAIQYFDEGSETLNKPGSIFGYYYEPEKQKKLIKTVVDAAILNDIYVIVDWHSHRADRESALAKTFFGEMAKEYKDVPNIIWEVYNEPTKTPSASDVSNYAAGVITEIRKNSTNLVIIGSPWWSSKPKEQASDWGSSRDKNVAFTFHFYASSHPFSGDYGTNVKQTMGLDNNNNLNPPSAVFCSEWSSVSADGQGSVNTSASDPWTNWMDENKVSSTMWQASDSPKDNNYEAKESQASAFFQRPTSVSELSTSRLTAAGLHFQTYMGKNGWATQIPSNHPKGNDVTATVKDGESVTIDNAKLGISSGAKITKVNAPGFGTVEFTDNSVKYTTSESGSPEGKARFTYEITKDGVTVQRKIAITITDRRPVLPDKGTIDISRKAPTKLRVITDFAAIDPNDPSNDKKLLAFKEASLSDPSKGTVSINKDTLTFTPAEGITSDEVTLTYTIQNATGASTAKVVLKLRNFAPILNTAIVNGCCAGSKPNTEPIGIGVKQVGAQDRDGDSLWFDTLYLDQSKYPGRIERVQADSFVYYPEDNKTGRVVFLSVVTDGELYSNIGKSALNLTGNGTAIGNVTVPDNIPGYEIPGPTEPTPIKYPTRGVNFAIRYSSLGNVEINFAGGGFAKLDVYSLSGKKMGTLLNGYQNAGLATVSLKNLNLQKGVYILRLSQGSQVKTLRVVH